MDLKNNSKFWLGSTIGYMVLLLGASLKPDFHPESATKIKQLTHNFAHIPAYSLLTFFLVNALGGYKITSKIFMWAFGISVVYGAFNEVVQSFVPGRTASLLDVGSNTLGTILILLCVKKGYFRITF